MKIYFSGSIAQGIEKAQEYRFLIAFLKSEGHVVLTDGLWDDDLHELLAQGILKEGWEHLGSPVTTFIQDMQWVEECDLLVAECSKGSLGVGIEIGYALSMEKPVICLYNYTNNNKELTWMITGNEKIGIIYYKSVLDAIEKLKESLDLL